MVSLEHIQNAVKAIKKGRPAYTDILEFYSQVFWAQARSRETVRIPPVEIDKEVLDIKKKNRMPLVDPSRFPVDMDNAVQLLKDLCDLAVRYAPGLSDSAVVIQNALENQDLEPESFFIGIQNYQEDDIRKTALQLGIPENQLVFFGYACIRPSLQVGAHQLKRYFAGSEDRDYCQCPVCGNEPDMAFLDQQGMRHIKCGFCHYEWPVKRMGCVFCGNSNKDGQYYLYSNEEKEYRVSVCDQCGRYIKVVDLRQMERRFFPDLEMVSTLHLDMTAREKGYTNAMASPNQLSDPADSRIS